MIWERYSPRRVALALGLILSLVWSYRLFGPAQTFSIPSFTPGNPFHTTSHRTDTFNLTSLTAGINLSETFTYAQRTIKTVKFRGGRPELTKMDQPLFPGGMTTMVLGKHDILDEVRPVHTEPLILRIPTSQSVDTSIFSFGIATPLPRLLTSLQQLSHWLPNSGSMLSVITPPESESTPSMRAEVTTKALSLNLDIKIYPSPATFPIAYFSLIKLLFDTRKPSTKWLVLIDDDTFIPSLPSLTAHLSRTYDDNAETLIAALTDDKFQIDVWGLIPFGGGGVFISISLAEHLLQPHIWDTCVTGMGQEQGDGILGKCLNEYTSVRPHFDLELNQMDLKGNVDGLFEGGRRMLTIHHWRSWFTIDVPLIHSVSKICGFEGPLMRFLFPAENLMLVNGFSITEYPDGVGGVDFTAVEKTWNGEAKRFAHHVGPLREAVEDGRKNRFGLVKSEVVEGGLRQLYFRPRGEGNSNEEEGGGMDGLLELFWLAS